MDHADTISVILNGAPPSAPPRSGLAALIQSLGLSAQGVLVEHNGTALLRDEWPSVRLADGDRLEILRVVAGG